ncbi:MAG: type II toxin-antitoxin system VapC family toxin [Pseudomonadota bacterium]
MRFWDSSAVIPLCFKESSSEIMKRLFKADEDMVVWWATRVECQSALARRRREGVLSKEAELKARDILTALSSHWSEIQSTELVRQRAERLLMIHPLRTADVLQLSAALIWAEESPKGQAVVCLDHNLRNAAHKEGFVVLPEKF